MIITAKDCWAGAKKLHDAYFDKNVVSLRNKYKADLTAEIYDFLLKNHNLIRDGQESDFRNLEAQYQAIYAPIPDVEKKKIDLAVRKIFDYSTFSKKCKVRWCAYKLCNQSNIKTCPYCNLSTEITIIEDKDGKIRPAIDHFLDKARYPIFAISLGNFIPSCHHCNSTFKGSKDFFSILHLNPLTDIESIKISLDVDEIDARIDIRSLDKANIKLIYDKTVLQAVNSVNTFKIEAQYQARIAEIREVAMNIVNYSTAGQNDAMQLGWVLRNVTTANYRDRIFGKMILDLSSVYL